MINLVIYVLSLAIYFTLLFYGNVLGVNVLLFNIPLLVFIIYNLHKNNKIKNKYGLLFIIPIIILSFNYLIYNNSFSHINFIIIGIMFVLMNVFTVNPTYKIYELFVNGFNLILNQFRFKYIKYFLNIVKMKLKVKTNVELNKKIKSFIIVIPIILIVLKLLISADLQFENLFDGIFKILKSINISGIFGRIILTIIVFIIFGSAFNYLLFRYGNDNIQTNKSKIKIDAYTIKVLLILLNIIYVVFDFIQIRSLLFHHVDKGIVYSEYARTGFFQLMFISIINIVILLLSKKSKESASIKHLSSLMVLLTSIIICSSFYRMYLYEMAYGYTVLRLLVYVVLITEFIMLRPTISYIYNSNLKILKYYIIIVVVVLSVVNLFSIDKVIARNNIKRFYKTNKIDIEYLQNYNNDNILELYNLYLECNDENIKNDLKEYFLIIKKQNKKTNVFEYNYSKVKSKNILKNIK